MRKYTKHKTFDAQGKKGQIVCIRVFLEVGTHAALFQRVKAHGRLGTVCSPASCQSPRHSLRAKTSIF